MTLLLLLLLACDSSEIRFPGDEKPTDTASPDSASDTDTDTNLPPPTEDCNGDDDDDDGLVDEDFPDDDGNGRADCLDVVCPALTEATGEVEVSRCSSAPDLEDPWNVAEGWDFTEPRASGGQSTYATTVVANLDDDDGDGTLDGPGDNPEVVTGIFEWGGDASLVVVDGATGIEEWSTLAESAYLGIAVGDLDGDGVPEIVSYSPANDASPRWGVVTAYDPDGTVLWETILDVADGYAVTSPVLLADLDGDGPVEIVVAASVLDGESGALRTTLDAAWRYWENPAVADVDMDGTQEIFVGDTLYAADGTARWTREEIAEPRLGWPWYPVFLQADADTEPELVIVGSTVSIWDTADGTCMGTFESVSGAEDEAVAPPCLGDFDGDGATELVVPYATQLALYELDGSLVWTAPYAYGGCTAYDLDGDGALEVLVNDTSAFHIFDGRTGAENATLSHGPNNIALDTPVPADLDGDGTLEIVVPNAYSEDRAQPALHTYHHDGEGWSATTRTWPAWSWQLTEISEAGVVSAAPTPWLVDNTLRAGRPADVYDRPDLVPVIPDVCVGDCTYGPVQLGVQVENRGPADVAAGVPLAIYAGDGTRLTSTTLDAIASGARSELLTFDLPPLVLDTGGILVVVDGNGTEEGATLECDETDGSLFYPLCP